MSWTRGEEADCGSRFVLVHHGPHEGNETHYVVDYYGVVNMWAAGGQREIMGTDCACE